MTELRLTSKCLLCDGTYWDEEIKRHCQAGCDEGKTVMVLKKDGVYYYEQSASMIDGCRYEINLSIESFSIIRIQTIINPGEREDITESLNILYLEVVEEQECPECEGSGWFYHAHNADKPLEGGKYAGKCKNCTDGKVEVVTGKYLFNPNEYDERIITQHLLETKIPNLNQGFREKELKESK